jgi:hypothetical protein
MQRSGGVALPPIVRNAPTTMPPLAATSSGVAASPASPPTVPSVPRRSCIQQPRVLVFALLFLTLTATFLSYILFMGGGGEDGWMPSLPLARQLTPRAPEDTWLKRPILDTRRITLEQKNDTASTTTESSEYTANLRTTLGADAMSMYAQCHNTIQGRKLVTDDAGAICARQHVLRNGCCRSTKTIDKVSQTQQQRPTQ